MENKKTHVLRVNGSSDFVKTLPYDFEDSNCVAGWDDLEERALCFATHEEATEAKQGDPDGDFLTVEEID